MGLPSVSGSVMLASLLLNDSAMPDILGGLDGGCQEKERFAADFRGIADIARHRTSSENQRGRTGKRKVLQGYSPAG